MRRRILLLVLAAVLLPCAELSAQSLQLGAGSWWLSGADLTRGTGVAATLRFSRGWTVRAQWQNGHDQAPFSNCGYGVPGPGATCYQGPSVVRAELATASLGYRQPLLETARASAGVRAGAGGGWLRASRNLPPPWYDPAAGRRLFVLLDAAVDAERQLVPSLPLRLTLAAQGGLALREGPRCTDCYPLSFEQGFRLAGLELGLVWPLGRARAARP